MASTASPTDDTSPPSTPGGLLGMLSGLAKATDPMLLINVGAGLIAGSKYGSNAGEGLLQGLQSYQQQKTAKLNNQIQQQQIQQGQLGLQRTQMQNDMAQRYFQGGQTPQGTAPQGGLAGAQPPPPDAQAPFLPGISPMPAGGLAGAQGEPQGAPQAPSQGLPQSLQPPSMSQIYGTTYPGGINPNYGMGMAMFSQDPAAAATKIREDQLKLAQQQAGPTLAKIDQIAKSDNPTKYLNGTGYADLKAAWPQIAARYGLDPQKDFNDQNVRFAMNSLHNEWAGGLQQPMEAPAVPLRTTQGPLGSVLQTNPITGEEKEVVKPQPLKDVLGPNNQPIAVRASAAEGAQPFNQVTYGSAQMQGAPGQLLAAMDARGISFPGGGGRSPQVQAGRAQALLAKYPDQTPDQIADMLRTGQLDFNGAKRSTSQLALLSGAAAVQSSKIEKDLNSLYPIVQQLPGGPATVANIFTHLQKDWSWNGDANSTQAVAYVKELSGEYAKLVSGSTGQAAPAEGEMKSALKLMQSALTKNGYQGMHDFLLTTSQNRRDAVREGLQTAATPGYATGQAPARGPQSAAPAPRNAQGWELHQDAKGNMAYVSPDGKQFQEVQR